MKRIPVSIILAMALFATAGAAHAGPQKSAEPGWGVQPERTAGSSPLDLARWLARRFVEAVAVRVPIPVDIEPVSAPKAAPGTTPAPDDGNAVCDPQRQHCPIG